MSKLAPTSIKYVIRAQINAKGVIEKPDVIGAVFGQTEGLLGSDLDLRELQRTGRIGRIEVNIKSDKGNSYGEVVIPSSLDSAETALIAATLETIERVGPCTAIITLKSVEDTRAVKRKQVLERAKMILRELMEKGIPDITKLTEEMKDEIKTYEVTTYQNLPCGPDIMDSEEIIIVEGRADVVNLLRYGIKNVIAIEGSSIPQAIMNISREKMTTAFLDGDRGGQLNLKGLLETAEIDFVAQAPSGKEVEELSKKEVHKALRDKISIAQFKMENREFARFERPPERPERTYQVERRPETAVQVRTEQQYSPSVQATPTSAIVKEKKKPPADDGKQKEMFKKILEELIGTRAACIYDSNFNMLGKVPVKELINVLKTVENPYTVVFDGKIDYKLVVIAKKKGIKYLIGMEKDDIKSTVNMLSRENLV
jgi:DNA primase